MAVLTEWFARVATMRGPDRHGFGATLRGQLAAARSGVLVADEVLQDRMTWADAKARLVDIEHDGDALRATLVGRLTRAMVTPIDREDLFRISRSIDDVLDNIRDFVREGGLFRPRDRAVLRPTLATIAQAIDALDAALATMTTSPSSISKRALEARKACNRVRSSYDLQLSLVFDQALDQDVLKQRELLRRLDVVGLRLVEAADALADAAVKRGDA